MICSNTQKDVEKQNDSDPYLSRFYLSIFVGVMMYR